MIETILKVDGMACGMCEAHVNDAIRKNFTVKKVSSSHGKGKTEILSEQMLDEEKLRAACNEQFSKMWATGASYGAKSFAQVVKDMLTENSDDMIEKITHFVDVTLKNSPEELMKAFAETQKRAKSIMDNQIRKDEVNEQQV